MGLYEVLSNRIHKYDECESTENLIKNHHIPENSIPLNEIGIYLQASDNIYGPFHITKSKEKE